MQILLQENETIKDSGIRSYLARYVDIEQMQEKLLEKWKSHLENKHVMLADAPVYESYIRYPTDAKLLLWESCEWIWETVIPVLCKKFKLKIARSKYKD